MTAKNSTFSTKNNSEMRDKRINNVYLEKFSTNFNIKEMRLNISEAEKTMILSSRKKK